MVVVEEGAGGAGEKVAMMEGDTGVIKKLPDDVVKKIAAGEVIQRPRNVVKELIENSLDAGATAIQVVVTFIGSELKFLQVKDDGCGIKPDDLPLACARHCTSKMHSLDGLWDMKTFGFRGEALASISEIARVEILTRKRDELVGYSMSYEGGEPVNSTPQPRSLNPGTIVQVNDLFYNLPHRKKTMKSPGEEYSLILEVVSLYSLNNLNTSFSLSKGQAAQKPDVMVSIREDQLCRIKAIFGTKVGQNLVPVSVQNDRPAYSVSGIVGDVRSSLKSYKFVFFINKRLVDCDPLKRLMEKLYKNFLPKGSCAFVLISLDVDPKNLDVNIHPTKNEVRFLHEQDIIDRICTVVMNILTTESQSQHVGLGASLGINRMNSKTFLNDSITRSHVSSSSSLNTSLTRRVEQQVRSDHSAQTIGEMFHRKEVSNNSNQIDLTGQEFGSEVVFPRRPVSLTSVLQLRDEVVEVTDPRIKTLVRNCTYVAVTNHRKPLLFLQYDTSLVTVDLETVSRDLMYQLYLKDFVNFPCVELEQAVSMFRMLEVFARESPQDLVGGARKGIETIISRRDMLWDYFSMRVDEMGNITSLPCLLEGYLPDWRRLPSFVHDLAFNVDWSQEKECFRSLGHAFASLFSATKHNVRDDDSVVRDIVFPILRKKLKPSPDLDSSFKKVTDTQTLYKIFHRC